MELKVVNGPVNTDTVLNTTSVEKEYIGSFLSPVTGKPYDVYRSDRSSSLDSGYYVIHGPGWNQATWFQKQTIEGPYMTGSAIVNAVRQIVQHGKKPLDFLPLPNK